MIIDLKRSIDPRWLFHPCYYSYLDDLVLGQVIMITVQWEEEGCNQMWSFSEGKKLCWRDQLCVHYLDLSNFLMVGHGWLAMRPARAAKPREELLSLNLEVREVIASIASLLYLLQEILSESAWVFQLLEHWPRFEVIFREKSTDRVSSGRSIRLSWSPGGNLGEDEQVWHRW